MVCLGCADKELIGIFTQCFVFGVVWRRFFFDGVGVGVGGVFVMGVARLGRVDKELIGVFAVSFVLGVVWRRGWGTWGNGATRGCLCWIKPRTSYLIAVCNLFGVVCVWGRGGVGDNFKKFIWGVMLLCVADFSSGEMQ